MSKTQIGDRMKTNYEGVYNLQLPMRLPTILRVDGKSFHTFTRGMDKPFDDKLIRNMADLSLFLLENIQTARFAYCQSDEISLLLHPYNKFDTQAWFNNEVQKMTSIAGGLASSFFTLTYGKLVQFDARVFVLPEEEVVNYFIWRQQDASRNSISMVAQSQYSHKELHKKNTSMMQDMLMEKGINWNDLPPHKKRGFCAFKNDVCWEVDFEPPIFTQDRKYVEKFLVREEM